MRQTRLFMMKICPTSYFLKFKVQFQVYELFCYFKVTLWFQVGKAMFHFVTHLTIILFFQKTVSYITIKVGGYRGCWNFK